MNSQETLGIIIVDGELIALKLQQIVEKNSVHQKQKQHEQHALITRGNAIKVFRCF